MLLLPLLSRGGKEESEVSLPNPDAGGSPGFAPPQAGPSVWDQGLSS